ncbi:MAG: ATP-binding protein, partial [Verrucomicrobiota bacterium]
VRSAGDIVSMTVSDDGPGISDAKRDQVFLPFERVNDATTEGVSGTGLGLAISRELAESMGGGLTLEADPDSTLTGAHFTMTLPAALSNVVPIAS